MPNRVDFNFLILKPLKTLALIAFVFSCISSFGQESTPSDSTLVATIFGSATKEGTFTRAATEDEIAAFNDGDSLTYQIVFKEHTRLYHEKYLIVIAQAEYGGQHGHQFGSSVICFFKPVNGDYIIHDTVRVDLQPIGSLSQFSIQNIGSKHKALLWTFESTGNHHFENNISFHLLKPGEIQYLFTIDLAYSNAPWKLTESEQDPCEAKEWSESYSIRTSDAEWFDVIIEHIDYEFGPGCTERIQTDKFVTKLIYKNGKYQESE